MAGRELVEAVVVVARVRGEGEGEREGSTTPSYHNPTLPYPPTPRLPTPPPTHPTTPRSMVDRAATSTLPVTTTLLLRPHEPRPAPHPTPHVHRPWP